MKTRPVLYTGSRCPLCEEAKALIYPLLPAGSRLRDINIDGDEALEARYGDRIPVFALVDDSGNPVRGKSWPFTRGQIRRLLAD